MQPIALTQKCDCMLLARILEIHTSFLIQGNKTNRLAHVGHIQKQLGKEDMTF